MPDVGRFFVILVDRDIEPALVECKFFSQELPGIGNRLFLEIVPKGKVAEHFEECVVPGGSPDIFQVVMLPPRPDALLGGAGPDIVPLLQPEKAVFELVHPRIGEQERRVIMRNQTGTGDHGMAPLRKIL
jgi:hypothetical protein